MTKIEEKTEKFYIQDYIQNYNSELIQTLKFVIKGKDTVSTLLKKSHEKISRRDFGVIKCFRVTTISIINYVG